MEGSKSEAMDRLTKKRAMIIIVIPQLLLATLYLVIFQLLPFALTQAIQLSNGTL
jgi:hypothetical protein